MLYEQFLTNCQVSKFFDISENVLLVFVNVFTSTKLR